MKKSGFAPKCRVLTANETSGTFETWKDILLFNLTLDGTFEFLLEEGFKWEPVSTNNRGLKDDTGSAADKKTGKQKAAILNLLLGTIAGYAPVISRQFITQEALGLAEIWHRLRIHYGFRKSGALILDLPSVHLEEGESYESLWERLHAFTMDNLLQPSDGLQHLHDVSPAREEMSPTLLNTTVVLWLRAIHPSLPALVKQRYSTELRGKTIATLREDISESLDSLVAELQGESAASIARSSVFNGNRRGSHYNKGSQYNKNRQYRQNSTRFCTICDLSNRKSDHFLSECPFLPEADKVYMSARAKTRAVEVAGEEFYDGDEPDGKPPVCQVSGKPQDLAVRNEGGTKVRIGKVTVESSPYLYVKYKDHPVKLTIDSGAQSNVMKLSFARQIGVTIYKTTSGATQADGITDMEVAGEVHIMFQHGNTNLYFDGLVTKDLSDDVLAGVPFMKANDVYACPSKQTVFVKEKAFRYNGVDGMSSKVDIIRIQKLSVLLPGDSVILPVPEKLKDEEFIAVEPRVDAPSLRSVKYQNCWLKPQVIRPVDKHITLRNSSSEPVSIKRFEHVATVRAVGEYTEPKIGEVKSTEVIKTEEVNPGVSMECSSDYKNIVLDPDGCLTKEQRGRFEELHRKYAEVFDSSSLGCYNGNSGTLKVKINMGPTLPPQRKGRMPLYNRSQMEEQQAICDELEGTVLLKPEDEGITCEYLNPSFLVNKKSGKKRLVTAFGEVGEHARPQPALMQDTNSVLRQIAEFDEIITSDLTCAYWQMELSRDSMRYCGVATPFKGIRVYGRGAMGMPGTETALEELMSRILGDLMKKGLVTKLADDIYSGGSSVSEVTLAWEKVLEALQYNGLRLSAPKTVICPKTIQILGWNWERGTIKASPHKISALSTVDPPQTVGKLRSFIGGVKFLSRVLKNYSDMLQPLEEVVAGRSSNEKIVWSEALSDSFKSIQERLKKTDTLVLPKRSDQIQIITDASNSGIGAAMYVIRNGSVKIAGYFSARYKQHQLSWMPCEAEALSINCAIAHFAPYIVDSDLQTTILTDSLPCVMAYKKLKRGQFSSSSRVSTFLSSLCRFNIHLAHLKGSENTYSDYASRNAAPCDDTRCQVCLYVQETINSVVRACTPKEIMESTVPVPYSSRAGWLELQKSDDVLRLTCALLKLGKKAPQKGNNLEEVKRYLNIAKVSRDGLLIVPQYIQSVGRADRIIVPRVFLDGLLECLHVRLEHPSRSQLKQVFNRAFYALDVDEAIEAVFKCCHTCVSLANMPNRFMQQSTTTVPTTVGSNFSADVVKRSGQNILILREYISSYTAAKLIWNEKASSIRTGLLILAADLVPSAGMRVTIKVDPASACRSLSGDAELARNGIQLELGHAKMKNKNPVAEQGIRELHAEINRVLGDGPNVTEILSKAVQNLNCRLRGFGVSSREIWTKRNQYTGEQIPIDDLLLMQKKVEKKKESHLSSATFKARGKRSYHVVPLSKGDLVYINSDRDKLRARDRYIVVSISEGTCDVQKFTGSQLRARVYTVNRADITKVQPWKFEGECTPDTSDSDSEDPQNESSSPPVQITGGEEVQPTEDAEKSDEETRPEVQEDAVITTRSGRQVRPPPHLKEYIL